jgi:2-oxoglutarate dehydrogenase E2 component (dihydrolipoamide succinyltransferase)
MATKVVMPQLGESVVEGTVMKWLRQEGEAIEEFESLLEVESAKVNTEIPSPADGVLLKILVPEGTTVNAGTIIAWVGEPGEDIPVEETGETPPQTNMEKSSKKETETSQESSPVEQKVGRNRDLGFISPVVAKLAREKEVDLYKIKGTGQGGRITKKDVLNFLETKAPESAPEPELAAWETPGEGDLFRPAELQFPDRFKKSVPEEQKDQKSPPVTTYTVSAEDKLVPHSNMRRSIAAHMVKSVSTAPHVTTVMEADLSAVVRHRAFYKGKYAQENVRLTFTPYFILASVAALKAYPIVNSSWQEDGILLRKAIHMGMATSLGEEGLIVPVIKHADNYSLMGMARVVNDLGDRAKNHQLKPDEVLGGTFTITNHGTSGSLFATPIINQPQCAILGVGVIKKRAIVIQDAIAIRPMVYLSLTFDHRILDGASADGFLAEIVKNLETWS